MKPYDQIIIQAVSRGVSSRAVFLSRNDALLYRLSSIRFLSQSADDFRSGVARRRFWKNELSKQAASIMHALVPCSIWEWAFLRTPYTVAVLKDSTYSEVLPMFQSTSNSYTSIRDALSEPLAYTISV